MVRTYPQTRDAPDLDEKIRGRLPCGIANYPALIVPRRAQHEQEQGAKKRKSAMPHAPSRPVVVPLDRVDDERMSAEDFRVGVWLSYMAEHPEDSPDARNVDPVAIGDDLRMTPTAVARSLAQLKTLGFVGIEPSGGLWFDFDAWEAEG